MANPSPADPARQVPFTLYAARGRIYARNVDQKVIDLGPLQSADGKLGYELDGTHERHGGFASEIEALRDIGRRVRFLWLDGQFTAVADARDGDLHLAGATELEITLDELRGEGIVDANV